MVKNLFIDVPVDGGTVNFDGEVENLVRDGAEITHRIFSVALKRELKEGEELSMYYLWTISLYAAIAFIRLKSTTQPDRIMVVSLQHNPNIQKLNWKYLGGYDAAGCIDAFPKTFDRQFYEFVVLPPVDGNLKFAQREILLAIGWAKLSVFRKRKGTPFVHSASQRFLVEKTGSSIGTVGIAFEIFDVTMIV